MGNFHLRNYQQKAVNDIKEAFENYDSILLQMPTGTGKTEVFSEYIKDIIIKDPSTQNILILAHTRELIEQIQKRLRERCGLKSSLIMAGYPIDLVNYKIQIASIQTLNKRVLKPENVSLMVIDEAHHATARTYRTVIDYYKAKGAKILGVTATPQRLDGTGFTDLFQCLITSNSIQQFIDDGYLSQFKHFSIANFDLEEVPIKNGDYDVESLFQVVSRPKIIADVIDSYLKHAEGKKALIFAVNKQHSKLIIERFKKLKDLKKEIKCAYIDSDTLADERKQIVKDFENNKYTILSNVQIFTEGYDCPDIETVILARPTKSLTLYLQMVGRVMRHNKKKLYALILDNAMLHVDHKLVNSEREWRLEGCKSVHETETKIENNNGEPLVVEVPVEVPATMKMVHNDKEAKGEYIRLKLWQRKDDIYFEYIYPKKIKVDLRTKDGRYYMAQRFANDLREIIKLNLESHKPDFIQGCELIADVFYNKRKITDKYFKNSIFLDSYKPIGAFIRKAVVDSLNSLYR